MSDTLTLNEQVEAKIGRFLDYTKQRAELPVAVETSPLFSLDKFKLF